MTEDCRVGVETSMRYHKGDRVTARRKIEDFDVPQVMPGTTGTVAATTLFGRPKKVFFSIQTVWGPKRFQASVDRRDVE
jgi:hypothetical protein